MSEFSAPSTITENWRDTVAISVGANYRLTEALLLLSRAGAGSSVAT